MMRLAELPAGHETDLPSVAGVVFTLPLQCLTWLIQDTTVLVGDGMLIAWLFALLLRVG